MSVAERADRPAIRIERFSLDHIEALLPIEHEAYPDPWTVGMFRQESQNPTSHFHVVCAAGEVIGYGGFWLLLDEAHVTKVTIAQAWRGCGYGRELLEFLVGESRRLGAHVMRLEARESNAAALALYESLGFQRIGLRRGYYAKANEAAVVMMRNFAPGDALPPH